MSTGSVRIRRVRQPEESALAELSSLLHATFADPDTVLELERMQGFLADTQRRRGRHFCVVVAEDSGLVVGGTVFSYVPASNCGFSEYLLVRTERHGQGIGRLLFDARQDLLDDLARESGHTACSGVFIEVDNPQRTPPDLLARERETAMDASTRLAVFAHLGFRRVEIEYVQPPLGPGKQPVSYLDLLFAPWDERIRADGRVPAAWVTGTLCPIWQSWAASDASADCDTVRQRLGAAPVALRPL